MIPEIHKSNDLIFSKRKCKICKIIPGNEKQQIRSFKLSNEHSNKQTNSAIAELKEKAKNIGIKQRLALNIMISLTKAI